MNDVYDVHAGNIGTHDVPLNVQETKNALQFIAETAIVLGASEHTLTLHYPAIPVSGAHTP